MSNFNQGDFILSEEMIKKIKADKRLQTTLQLALKCSEKDFESWLGHNNPGNKLTNIKCVAVLYSETGVIPNKILVQVPHGTTISSHKPKVGKAKRLVPELA